MKKQYSLLLPLLLSSCANGFLANDKSNVIEGDIDLSILPTLKHEILEDHRYISDITSALYGSYKTIIESSDTRYYSELYVENKLVSFESHQKGLEGELLNESLNVDNTVYSETLVEDNVTLLYKDYHQTLFQNFKSISDNDLDKYFTPYKVEDKYYVTLSTFGEGLLFSTLDIFFKDIDSYIWDKETLKYTYKEVVFTFDKALSEKSDLFFCASAP